MFVLHIFQLNQKRSFTCSKLNQKNLLLVHIFEHHHFNVNNLEPYSDLIVDSHPI